MLFSIIIGYRNRDLHRIKIALEYIDRQSNKNFEVIFIDYGSDEVLANEAKALLDTYSFVFYTFNNTQGWFWNRAHALNTGLNLAKGEIVLMYDIDLIVETDFIEKISRLDFNNVFYIFECFYLPQNFDCDKKNVFNDGIHHRQDYVGLCAGKKEDLLAINGFDEFFMVWGAEDEDLYKRLENNGLVMKRQTAREYSIFHQWHPTESPSFPTLWYITMIDRLFKINRQLTKVDQVCGQIINQKNRKIFTHIDGDHFDINLKLQMGNKFLVFHDFTADFLNPTYLSGKFNFSKLLPKEVPRKKTLFSLLKKNIDIEYISAREITEFIQYLVGTNKEMLQDYYFNAKEDEVNFYYLKKGSNSPIANG